MALIVNTQIKNDFDGYSLDASAVKGGYVVVSGVDGDTKENLPSATIVEGSLVYDSSEKKSYRYTSGAWVEEQGGSGDAGANNIRYREGESSGYTGTEISTTEAMTALYINPAAGETTAAKFADMTFDVANKDGTSPVEMAVDANLYMSWGVMVEDELGYALMYVDNLAATGMAENLSGPGLYGMIPATDPSGATGMLILPFADQADGSTFAKNTLYIINMDSGTVLGQYTDIVKLTMTTPTTSSATIDAGAITENAIEGVGAHNDLLTELFSFNDEFEEKGGVKGGFLLYKDDTEISGQDNPVDIKTLAGESLIGSGNIKLKTINNESIIGSGDIDTEGYVLKLTATSDPLLAATTGSITAEQFNQLNASLNSRIELTYTDPDSTGVSYVYLYSRTSDLISTSSSEGEGKALAFTSRGGISSTLSLDATELVMIITKSGDEGNYSYTSTKLDSARVYSQINTNINKESYSSTIAPAFNRLYFKTTLAAYSAHLVGTYNEVYSLSRIVYSDKGADTINYLIYTGKITVTSTTITKDSEAADFAPTEAHDSAIFIFPNIGDARDRAGYTFIRDWDGATVLAAGNHIEIDSDNKINVKLSVNSDDTATETLTKLKLDDTVYEVKQPIAVAANPTDASTQTLTKLKVDSVTYEVGSDKVEVNPTDASTGTLTKLKVNKLTYTIDTPTINPEDEATETASTIKVGDKTYYLIKPEYEEYLHKMTYKTPTITFTPNLAGGTYEMFCTKAVGNFNHIETNISNFDGKLTFVQPVGTMEVTPSEQEMKVFVDSPYIISVADCEYYIKGTDTDGNEIKSNVVKYYLRYFAYMAQTIGDAVPTEGTSLNMSVESFATDGASISYTEGATLYLYTRSTGGKVQTNVMGTWADVDDAVEVGEVDFKTATNQTVKYYAYKVGTMAASGTATYRII